MKIHLAAEDSEIIDRCVAIVENHPKCLIVGVSCDPQAVRRLVESRQVDIVIHSSSSLRTLFAVAQDLGNCQECGQLPRSTIVARRVDRCFVYEALAYGADDVVEFNQSDENFIRDLKVAASGKVRACESFLIRSVEPPPPLSGATIGDLIGIDLKIARLVSMGYSDRDIADLLSYSHQTIRNKVSKLLERLELRNRTQIGIAYIFHRMSELESARNSASALSRN